MKNKKKFVMISDIKVELNKEIKDIENLDPFKRASYLISGKLQPQNESDQKIIDQAKEIIEKGGVIEIPEN